MKLEIAGVEKPIEDALAEMTDEWITSGQCSEDEVFALRDTCKSLLKKLKEMKEWALDLKECDHALCSVSEAIYEEIYGDKILRKLKKFKI